MRIREHKSGSVSITVRPAAEIGLATIFDKDVWLFAISKLQEAINNNEPISKTVVFTPYDYLFQTNREIGGRMYRELKNSLSRLKGTTVKTNISHSPDEHVIREFGLIEEWMIVENKKGKMDVGIISVTLPDWLY